MPRHVRPALLLALLTCLGGCAGFGNYTCHLLDPFHAPHRVKSDAANVALAHGKSPTSANLTPEPGQPWPTSYPVDPTIMDIERSGSGVP